jgi:hypothetical protein
MKLFRPSVIEGSKPNADGFGYVWDSDTGVLTELRWTWPAAHRTELVLEGYRQVDGKVWGITYYRMEADGQYYASSIYLATPGSDEIVVNDLYGQSTDTTFALDRNNQLWAGDKFVTLQRSGALRYAVVDFSGATPTFLTGDCAAWINSDAALTDYDVLRMNDGTLRLLGLYTADSQLVAQVSSVLDGSAITYETTTLSPPIDLPYPANTEGFMEGNGLTAAWLIPQLPILADAQVVPAYFAGNITGFGLYAQPYPNVGYSMPMGDVILNQLVYASMATGEAGAYEMTTVEAANGEVATFSPPIGDLMERGGVLLYPDTVYVPPVIPPFWRGFLRTEETI